MTKLTVDECKRIISKGRKQLTEAEKRIAELEAENDRLRRAGYKEAVRMMGEMIKEQGCGYSDYIEVNAEYDPEFDFYRYYVSIRFSYASFDKMEESEIQFVFSNLIRNFTVSDKEFHLREMRY